MDIKKFIKPSKRKKFHDPFAIKSGRFKNGKLDTVYRNEWAEDVYISDNESRETIGNNFNFNKLVIITIAMAILTLVLLAKTAWLQIVKGDYYYAMAEGNRLRTERIEPKRGVIYDREMRPLVRNVANFLLYVIPADLPNEEEAIREIVSRIAEILRDVTADDILRKLAGVPAGSLEAYIPLFIDDHIDYESAILLYLETDRWPGVVLSSKSNRDYLMYYAQDSDEPEPLIYHSLSHILGYTGKINQEELARVGQEYLPIDYIGKMGIEYFWENELKGMNGQKQVEVDALGKEKKIIGQAEAVDGNNLVLAIDVMIQIKLEEVLASYLNKQKLSRGSAIVMDPSNGEVLAVISLPAYNNNQFARGISIDEYQALISHPDKPLFNRAISGEYPSGSTIKPVIAAAALAEGIITEHTSFYSQGGVRIGQWFFPDWRAGGHGRISVKQAIAESVNTFFYYIGGGYEDIVGLGVDRIVHYGELFGLGTQTGVDLAGEASGFLPTKAWKEEAKGESWYIGDTYHLAIGQGDLLVTPLQVAAYTNVFANGGALYRPHIVRMILSGRDEPLSPPLTEPIRNNFIDESHIKIVREGMRQTVISGSARSLQIVPVAVAGKTGTAQWSSVKPTHAWFTGFAPFDDPEITITILVEEGGEGSDIAVPIAREFLTWYFDEYKTQESSS